MLRELKIVAFYFWIGKFMNFKQVQELVTGMRHFIKNQHIDVSEKSIVIQFSTSKKIPSLVAGIVDRLNIDKLFSEKQAFPTTVEGKIYQTDGVSFVLIRTIMPIQIFL